MQKFNSAGVEIAFKDRGTGEPILLIHGFASNHAVNWVATGWEKTLLEAGYRVVQIDNRGHGHSQKLYAPADYSSPIMADDAKRLLDHLGITRAAVMGYSMGARISAFLTLHHPERVSRVIFAGLAEGMVTGVPGAEAIADGLEAPSLADVTDPGARSFRIFAQNTKSDLRALAACMRSSRVKIKPEALASIKVPVLVVAGDADDVAGPVAPLVALMPTARGVSLPGRNHMNAVGDRGYKQAVLEFLSETKGTAGPGGA
ncbi:MAG: alpha/beta hydrolase [Rhizobiales bacterium]|nr:alpha/beta hydrolase [Hyphomicrobiales bacterium]